MACWFYPDLMLKSQGDCPPCDSGFSRKEHKGRKAWGGGLAHATFAKSAKFFRGGVRRDH